MIDPAGWLEPHIADAMRQLIVDVRPNVYVEIGVFAGKSLINAAEAMKDAAKGTAYGIDPWKREESLKACPPEEKASFWEEIDLDAVHYDCMHAIWERHLDNIVIIRATSQQASKLFCPLSIDILYIDGGHSEETSTLDAMMYLPKVTRGGHIWLDDTNYASLRTAINILGEQCTLLKDHGHCRLYRRN